MFIFCKPAQVFCFPCSMRIQPLIQYCIITKHHISRMLRESKIRMVSNPYGISSVTLWHCTGTALSCFPWCLESVPGLVCSVCLLQNLQEHFILWYKEWSVWVTVRNSVEDWTVKNVAFSSDRCGMSSRTHGDKMSRFKGSVLPYWILKQYRCTSTSQGVHCRIFNRGTVWNARLWRCLWFFQSSFYNIRI